MSFFKNTEGKVFFVSWDVYDLSKPGMVLINKGSLIQQFTDEELLFLNKNGGIVNHLRTLVESDIANFPANGNVVITSFCPIVVT